MTIPNLIYAVTTEAAALVLPRLAVGSGKVARGVRGMHGSLPRFESWSRSQRDPTRPLVWFHAPSVGEGFQAKSVMEALRAIRPDVQVAYTYFSPSAEPFARATGADVTDYLPIDAPSRASRMFDALRPSVVVFTKTEVWPGYSAEAARRGVSTILISATLPADSSRLGFLGRTVLRPAHRRLTAVAAISSDHAERYEELGVSRDHISVMGDARFDQVARRAALIDGAATMLDRLGAEAVTTIVAGSTWPPDDDRLLPAFAACLDTGINLRLILAPHEPTHAHIGRAESILSILGLRHARLTKVLDEEAHGGSPAQAIIVDRLGALGDLYALADVAYVGGGFGHAGLHSVLEPAAFGVPVLFGPRHTNAREASELIAHGGAFSVVNGDELEERLRAWLTDDNARTEAGQAAADYVESGLGAAERGAHLILGLLEGPRHSRESGNPGSERQDPAGRPGFPLSRE